MHRDDDGRALDKTTRTIRAELVIATLALLASAGATVASVVQTHVIGDQLSSSVWPYLSLQTEMAAGKSLTVSLVNDGLGPALVRSAVVKIDGRAARGWHDALTELGADPQALQLKKGSGPQLFASFGQGTVLRAGNALTVARIENPGVVSKISAELRRVSIDVCYCSILQKCWLLDTVSNEPPTASTCTSSSSIAY